MVSFVSLIANRFSKTGISFAHDSDATMQFVEVGNFKWVKQRKMSQQYDSTDLFVLKHLWKLTPEHHRKELLDELSDCGQPPAMGNERFAHHKRIWLRLSDAAREDWRQWTETP